LVLLPQPQVVVRERGQCNQLHVIHTFKKR
jgi:hypothetical protein